MTQILLEYLAREIQKAKKIKIRKIAEEDIEKYLKEKFDVKE